MQQAPSGLEDLPAPLGRTAANEASVRFEEDRLLMAEKIGELDSGGLNSVLEFQLRQSLARVCRAGAAGLQDLGLTHHQVSLLWLIGSNPSVAQITLAKAVQMDRASAAAVVRALEDKGLVVRQQSTVDRRRQQLQLTPSGQRTLVHAKAAVEEQERCHVQRFAPGELRQLFELLERLDQPSHHG